MCLIVTHNCEPVLSVESDFARATFFFYLAIHWPIAPLCLQSPPAFLAALPLDRRFIFSLDVGSLSEEGAAKRGQTQNTMQTRLMVADTLWPSSIDTMGAGEQLASQRDRTLCACRLGRA